MKAKSKKTEETKHTGLWKAKEILSDGLSEIIRNPEIISETIEETQEDVQALINKSMPVLNAILKLLEAAKQVEQGFASRTIDHPQLMKSAAKLAKRHGETA